MGTAGANNFVNETIESSFKNTESEEQSKPDINSIPVESLTIEDLELLRITKEKDIPKLPAHYTMNGAFIAKAGNVTGISALQKAGKSGLQSHLAALAISPTGNTADSLPGLNVLANQNKHAVIIIDTEQSEEDQQINTVSILKMSRYSQTPDHCRFYNIRQLSLQNYKGVTQRIIELCAQQCGGVHSVFIDGGADFVSSVNDEEESNDAIHFFIQISIKYNCPVFIIVHLNPNQNNSKERGHFGSTLLRKCYAMLTIEKKDDISTVTCKLARRAADADTQPIHFIYSKEKGYHISVEHTETINNKDEKKLQQELSECRALANKVLAPHTALKYKELTEKLIGATGKGLSTAKRKITVMVENTIISLGADKLYRIEKAI